MELGTRSKGDSHRFDGYRDTESPSDAKEHIENGNGDHHVHVRSPTRKKHMWKDVSSKKLEITFIVCFQLITSISMMLINKASVHYISYPITLLVLQTVGTVIILEIAKVLKFIHYDNFRWEHGGKQFVGVSIAFIVPMVFNMLALKHVSVATVVVFRQVSTALVACGEYFIFKKRFSRWIVLAIGLGIIGSIVYGFSATDFKAIGYIFAFLYACSMTVNALYIKTVFDQLPQMSNFEKTFYQNFLGTPFVVVLALIVEDFSGFIEEILALNVNGCTVLIISCFAGFAVSVAGIMSRTALSPTSFNILGNMSKPLTVFLSFFIFQAETSLKALTGLMMVLMSGIWYSYATQKK